MDNSVLILVPPFHSVERPSIGAHIVKAQCIDANIPVKVVYLNLTFAAIIGFENYKKLCNSQTSLFLGESIFAGALMGDSALAYAAEKTGLDKFFISSCIEEFGLQVRALAKNNKSKIVGCTSMFQQNNASFFVLQLFKLQNPEILTVLGGGGCSEQQCLGLKILAEKYYPSTIDYIFSGETEQVFTEFVRQCWDNFPPVSKTIQIVRPHHEISLEKVPVVNYGDFFEQAAFCEEGITPSTIWLPVETSRGCWWGMKSHCTFCPLSKKGVIYRRKSSDRIKHEISLIAGQNLSKKIIFIDSILPVDFPNAVLSTFKSKGLYFYMEHKVPLRYGDAKIMAEAGVVAIQPGMESLSLTLLKKMKKGIHPSQNIELLRYCKMFDINVEWNLLHGIPGETSAEYSELIEVLDPLEHLNAPSSLSEISLERLSPYVNTPDEFGIIDMRPVSHYQNCYPSDPLIHEIYGCFEGNYPRLSYDDPALFSRLHQKFEYWQASWKDSLAELSLTTLAGDRFMVKDTRKISTKKWNILTRNQAAAIVSAHNVSPEYKHWAIQHRYAIYIGGTYVPLATCSPALYEDICNIK